jgi:hypothetical protein
MPRLLRSKLERTGKKLLPNYILVADWKDAFVLHLDEHGFMHATEVPQRELLFLSIRGINAADSVMTRNVLDRMRAVALPAPARPNGWDPWIRALSIPENFGDDWAREGAVPYLSPEWRSHYHTVIQPPYLNVPGPRNHTRAVPEKLLPGDVVEWTASSTFVAADAEGRFVLLYNERHLDEGAPFPTSISEGSYPASTLDYTPVALLNGAPPVQRV